MTERLPIGTIIVGDCCEYVIKDVSDSQSGSVRYVAAPQDKHLPDEVLIKAFPSSYYVSGFEFLKEFKHSGLATVFETFEEDSVTYVVMERIEGKTLDRLVEDFARTKAGLMPEHVAETIIRQLADTVAYLHHRGVAGLNLSPSLITVTPDMDTVISDFALSNVEMSGKADDDERRRRFCEGYSAPELYMGVDEPSSQSDVFSLGAIFYTLLTGKIPPSAGSLYTGVAAPVLPKDTEPDFRYAVHKAMAANPRRRLRSVAEFLSILDYGTDSSATDSYSLSREGLASSVEQCDDMEDMNDRRIRYVAPERKTRRRGKTSLKLLLNLLLCIVGVIAIYCIGRSGLAFPVSGYFACVLLAVAIGIACKSPALKTAVLIISMVGCSAILISSLS